jgi:hypothetical protein
MQVSEPPAGSRIAVDSNAEELRLSWPNPRGGVGRYLVALFLLGWLGAWAAGFVLAFGALFGSDQEGLNLFLAGWLLAWTAGGVFAIWFLLRLARGSRDEVFVLAPYRLEHDPGEAAFDPFLYFREQYRSPAAAWKMLRKPKVTRADRESVGEIKLVTTGERQRLTFDVGANRVEVGRHLREPEREWLADVLAAWRAAPT